MFFAVVFPGQGSQAVGMLASLAKDFPVVMKTFQQASKVLGYDLWQLIQTGPEEKLNQTEFTQPALLAADVAVWRCWVEQGGKNPEMFAGHSLGEYAALVCAQALSFEDGINLVAKRGRYMQDAVELGQGAVAAIVGLDDIVVIKLCEQASENQVIAPANFNSIGQVVVAGHAAAVERVINLAKEKGAKIAKCIPVSVPVHCSLMQPAAERLQVDLEKTHFETPKIPVLHNFDVKTHQSAIEIREVLVKQLVYPVRWVETIKHMRKHNITTFLECGPGKVLSGLNKRILADISCLNINDTSSMNLAIENLGG